MPGLVKEGNSIKKVGIGGPYQPSTLDLENRKLNKDYSNTQPAVADIRFASDSYGVILMDRTDGTPYRLYIDNGVLGIESV